MHELVIIADDLSGAADCGIACVNAGLSTLVSFGELDENSDTDVLSIDADTRGLNSEAAANRTADLVRRYITHDDQLLFKKLDSTMRGNVAAELAAALEARRSMISATEHIVAVMAPAFPASGRTTVAGHQLLHGKHLHETDMWKREEMQGRCHIPTLLHAAGMRPASLDLQMIRSGEASLRQAFTRLAQDADVLVCDAETDHDLRAIATASIALGRATVWAGSAGLAHHLPHAAALSSSSPVTPMQPLPSGPTLFVVGSLSNISRAQVKVLLSASEVISITVSPTTLLAGPESADWREHQTVIDKALRTGQHVAIMVSDEDLLHRALGNELARALAAMLAHCSDTIGALVATGGESARAVLQAWGVTKLRLIRELEAGLPLSVTSGRLPVITKAGGFGNSETLLSCHQYLRSLERSSPQALLQGKGYKS